MSVLKNTIYHLLDLLTLNAGIPRRINGHLVRFPAKWSRYFEPDYEKANMEFLTQHCKAGMTVADIGAHLGLMSVILSKCVGKEGAIYAFEPTESTFAVLQKIIRMNGAEKIIRPFRKAVSNFEGELNFFVDEQEGSNANSLVNRPDKSRSFKKVEVISLDHFITSNTIPKLDILKIDAEGSELDVLLGAEKILLQFRPKIILAMHPPLIKNNLQKPEEIYDLITRLKYTVTFRGKQMTRQDFSAKTDFFDVHLIPDAR